MSKKDSQKDKNPTGTKDSQKDSKDKISSKETSGGPSSSALLSTEVPSGWSRVDVLYESLMSLTLREAQELRGRLSQEERNFLLGTSPSVGYREISSIPAQMGPQVDPFFAGPLVSGGISSGEPSRRLSAGKVPQKEISSEEAKAVKGTTKRTNLRKTRKELKDAVGHKDPEAIQKAQERLKRYHVTYSMSPPQFNELGGLIGSTEESEEDA